MERVIFRKEFNPLTKGFDYLAAFPDDEAGRGRIAVSPFALKNDGTAVFEPYTEVPFDYYYRNKLVRRRDPKVGALRRAIEDHYGTKFRVCEKI